MISFFVIAIAVSLMTACEKQEMPEQEQDAQGTVTVTFRAPQWGESSVGLQQTRAALEADGKAMTDFWLLDYMDGELQAQIHQTNDQADFAEPRLTMDYGRHTLYFVASRGTSPETSTDSHTITWEKTSDTFWTQIQLDVTASTEADQTVTLQRSVARLMIAVADEVPSGATTLTVTPEHWYYGIDYLTGQPVADQREPRSITIPESYIGTSGKLKFSMFTLAGTEAFTTDIEVMATDAASAPLGAATISGARLERNHSTNYTGTLFTTPQFTRSISVSLDDEWGEDIDAAW